MLIFPALSDCLCGSLIRLINHIPVLSMKLKLPFALLASLLVCLNGVMAEETTETDITPEEGDTTEGGASHTGQ